MKPKVFIGSSREGLAIANAIHGNLTREAECTVWANGVFQLSSSALSDLIRVLRESDFGIFVFSPDDVTIMRDEANNSVRDNVIFELGLFIGRLGAERCYFLVPEGVHDLRLPSDLAGITPGVYETGRRDNNLLAALNPACMQISLKMASLKTFQDAAALSRPAIKSTNTPPKKPSAITPPKKPSASSASKKEAAAVEAVTAEKYKSMILLKGGTKPYKEAIKGMGGRWIGPLGGWTVSVDNFEKLKSEIPNIEGP